MPFLAVLTSEYTENYHNALYMIVYYYVLDEPVSFAQRLFLVDVIKLVHL